MGAIIPTADQKLGKLLTPKLPQKVYITEFLCKAPLTATEVSKSIPLPISLRNIPPVRSINTRRLYQRVIGSTRALQSIVSLTYIVVSYKC